MMFSRRVPLLLVLAVIAYMLPWIVNPGVSLTFGAYDLAEWASLHPAARGGTLPFLISLLLRLPLATVPLIAVVNAERRVRVFIVLLVLIIAIALLPPVEFFTSARDDLNYRQQFALSLATLFTGLLAYGIIPHCFYRWSAMLFVVVGIVSAIAGLLQIYTLMREFNLPARLGAGGVLFSLVYILLGVTILRIKQGASPDR